MPERYEKWLWLELIGFELNSPDLGVGAYLDRLGFKPTGLSLLIQSPNFIHMHGDGWEKRTLPPEYCSYGAHNANGERVRQDWTGAKLRQLLDELHRHGVEVCFTVFDLCILPEWLEAHPELFYIGRDGQRMDRIVCPWKRFADGSFYEDFFTEKLTEVMRDYGFDGFHAGDGFAHPRLAIFEGDFSDDMVGQFIGRSGIGISLGVFNPRRSSKAQTRRVTEWILSQHPLEWREFLAGRSADFWAKVARRLKSMGKWLIYNSAWTRDPFEAIYRYGIDYQALCKAGVDKYVVELAGPCLELENWGRQEPRTIYSRMASTLLLRGHVPEAKLVFLNGIRDFNEQYFILQHAPALYESEVLSQYNLFHLTGEGKWKRCQDGVLACLADALTAEEWKRINRIWDIGSGFDPETVYGSVLLCSGRHLYQQLATYIKHRRWYDYRLLTHLLSGGAPIHAVANVVDIEKLDQQLVILDPESWEDEELKRVASYRKRPVICLGYETRALPFRFDLTIRENRGANSLYCGILNCADQGLFKGMPWRRKAKTAAPPPAGGGDPSSWLDDLPVPESSTDFLRVCAGAIARLTRCPHIQCIPGDIKTEVLSSGGIHRLIIWNDRPHYERISVSTDRPVKSIAYAAGFIGCEILASENRFNVKLPPSGITIVDMIFQ